MATCSATRTVKYLRKGEDGRGISEQLQYWAISASKDTAPTYPSDPATAPSSSIWSTSVVTPTSDKPYLWTYTRYHWTSGTAWTQTTPSIISMRASDGKRGAYLHRIYDWDQISGLGTSLTLYSINGSEDYYDIIYNGGGYFMPTKDGTVKSLGTPSSSNSNYQLETYFAYVVSRAVIADAIYMTDDDGAVVFSAKDGDVTCKTGTFENVKVSGNITASTMNMKMGTSSLDTAALYSLTELGAHPGKTLQFPALSEGTTREYVIWYPNGGTRAAQYDVTVSGLGGSSKIKFIPTPESDASAATTSLSISPGTFARLIGLRASGDDNTYYVLCKYS